MKNVTRLLILLTVIGIMGIVAIFNKLESMNDYDLYENFSKINHSNSHTNSEKMNMNSLGMSETVER